MSYIGNREHRHKWRCNRYLFYKR